MCISTVYEFCIRHQITSCKVLLAVSGGSDSVALFHLFVALQKRLDISEIGVAHVNHQLRPDESVREEEFVSQLAAKHGCRFHSKKLQGKSPDDPGIEEWARKERYRFFMEVKEEFGYKFIATGHTADDQAETILMRLSRGSGMQGLCGILPVREDGVVRPLISERKDTLQSWLEKKGLKWYEDSSNTNLKFKRNWIRHSIVPLLVEREPKAVENLASIAENMQEQARFCNPLINKWITDHVITDEANRIVLRKPEIDGDYFPAAEGCARLFREHGISFDRAHIVSFLKELHRSSGCFLLRDGWQFYPGKDRVEIVLNVHRKEESFSCRVPAPGTIDCDEAGYRFTTEFLSLKEWDGNFDVMNETVFLDAEKTGNVLIFRNINEKDIFLPLGYEKPVNCIRFLKKQKLSTFYRQSMGALAEGNGEIVWIPGVAMGHKCRIIPATKTIVRISCRSIS